jgi:uncharacterized membrane protein (UPF0127 family)
MSRFRVENLTRGATLVTAGRVADNYWTQLRGLIGHRPLEPGEGLLIPRCNSVHTHFMRFPIDVLFVDRDHQVVAVTDTMKPWRFGRIHRRASYVIELPSGTVAGTGTRPGDQLRVDGHKA